MHMAFQLCTFAFTKPSRLDSLPWRNEQTRLHAHNHHAEHRLWMVSHKMANDVSSEKVIRHACVILGDLAQMLRTWLKYGEIDHRIDVDCKNCSDVAATIAVVRR